MKMNHVCIYFLLTLLMINVSCDSVLEVEPKFHKEGAQIFKTIEDYEYSLTGTYELFRAVGYYASGAQTTSTWANLPDMMGTDLVRTSEDLANWQTQCNWTYTADENDLEIAWLAAYVIISQANLTLRNIDQFAETNTKAVNRIKGQALAIRGLAHFDLFRYWAESFDRNSTSYGIPYVEHVDAELKPTRLNVKESYDKILSDLETAEILLSDVDQPINSGSTRFYIDQLVVKAILARVSLYAKDYEKAESFATQVIDSRPLIARPNFPNIWVDAVTTEVIWSIAFNFGEGSPTLGVHNSSINRNRFKPSAALEATYDQDSDIRFPTYFATRTLSGNPRRILTKFYGRSVFPAISDNVVNWKAFRTAEMYLIRAEARAMSGGVKESDGLADLNTLRAARIGDYVDEDLAGPDLVDAIMLERRKELVGEGHQWFDIKRTTRTINRPADDVHLSSTPLTLTADSREWVWPIPTREINNNANIRSQQSPGY